MEVYKASTKTWASLVKSEVTPVVATRQNSVGSVKPQLQQSKSHSQSQSQSKSQEPQKQTTCVKPVKTQGVWNIPTNQAVWARPTWSTVVASGTTTGGRDCRDTSWGNKPRPVAHPATKDEEPMKRSGPNAKKPVMKVNPTGFVANLDLTNVGEIDEDAKLSVPLRKTKYKWAKEQNQLASQLCLEDDPSLKPGSLKYIGGMDISFVKGSEVDAVSSLVIVEYPSMDVVYEDHSIVKLDQPYIAGYLAFREVPHMVPLIERLEATQPEFRPQLILCDGNGVLHYRGFGVASHMGVLTGIPTIGVAKNLLVVDGITRESLRPKISVMKKKGDHFPLIGRSGTKWGYAVRTGDSARNPVFVSPGHKVSFKTAVELTLRCSKVRVPEPVRQADLRSRNAVRQILQAQ